MSQSNKYQWATKGDVNAFFGLVLDNIAGMVLIVELLKTWGIEPAFCLRHMLPGTAVGVLVGDGLFFIMALLLAKRTGNRSITAMPLGLDTPSIFGITLFVIGPAYQSALASNNDPVASANIAWKIGICSLFISGIFKLFCAAGSNWARNTVPRAGLLGSLTAIALVLISFLPLLEVMAVPVVGMAALSIVLISLIGQVSLPWKMPGTVAALVVAGSIYYIMLLFGLVHVPATQFQAADGLRPTEWMQAWSFEWWASMGASVTYLPIVLPFAFATVIGGIDCTESAAAAGDHYNTGSVILVEAIATIAASLCGGICQTTPYIGHPAYKAMGGRAAYVLATAIVIGGGGLLGLYGYFYQFIPKAAVYPILIFIGLEITSQSFAATPKRHYAAVGLACVPALAFLAVNFVGQMFGDPLLLANKISIAELKNGALREALTTANLLSHGFIVTSLIWASALAVAIDRKLKSASLYMAIAGVCAFVGIIHSPLDNGAIFLPISIFGFQSGLTSEQLSLTLNLSFAYWITACILFGWGMYLQAIGEGPIEAELNNAERDGQRHPL